MRPLPPLEPLSHMSLPSLLPCVEVSCPKTINIKQYLNVNDFSSNLHKQHNFILQKYFINNSVVIITYKNHCSSQILLKLTLSDSVQSHDHLKRLIFDCISFTEGLITSLSTADIEAPASTRNFVTSLLPCHAARCRGVMP